MPLVIGEAVSFRIGKQNQKQHDLRFDQAAPSIVTNPSLQVALAADRMPRGAMMIL